MPPVTVIREELPNLRYTTEKKEYIILIITTKGNCMLEYINFTKEQKKQARQTNIASLLIRQGEILKKSGSEYYWLDGSQKVTIRGNLWYHQYEQKGGDAVDFVRRFYNKNYVEAVQFLLNESHGQIITSMPIEKENKSFKLPPRNDRMNRVFSYLLLTRGIDKDVLYEFVRRKMIYESSDFHNAIFVGYDLSGKPTHAHKRGTVKNNHFKGNVAGSKPEYSFHYFGKGENLFLFEAPIDMLSYISMHKVNYKNNNYAASCSVSDRVLFQCLKDNPNIKKVYLCFDNDSAGQTANKRISEKLNKMNINNEIVIPTHKDWNDDLLFLNKGDEQQCQQVLSL